jgi:localization factor PodJL
MTSGAPWSVKGIDPKAREVAKDLARRSGMTLGEWLNQMIMEEPEASAADAAEEPAPIAAEEFGRVSSALDRLATRIESAEHRSTLAISGIDQSVNGLLTRLESAERDQTSVAARFERAVQELADDQVKTGERLVRLEEEAGAPKSLEALRALEAALGRVAAHLYDSESRTREGLDEIRTDLGSLSGRVDGLDSEVKKGVSGEDTAAIENAFTRMMRRLEAAEQRTSTSVQALETAFADVDRRLRAQETRNETPEQRLEELAETLSRNLEAARSEMAATVTDLVDRGVGERFESVERSLGQMNETVQSTERRSTQAIERIGEEVLRMAGAVDRRMKDVESSSADALSQVGGEVTRVADAVEARMRRSDSLQAESLEKLGGEIARITERLAERIANAERRSAQAIDDVGEQVSRVTERINQGHERAAHDLADRIRQSEERTARLLEDAREKIDRRLADSQARLEQTAVAAAAAPQALSRPAETELYSAPDLAPGPFSRDAFGPLGFSDQSFEDPAFPDEARAFGKAAPEPSFEADDFEAADEFEPYPSETAEASQPTESLFEDAQADDDQHHGAIHEDEDPTGARATTRELIAQARAAARSASEPQGKDAGASKPIFSGLSFGQSKKKKAASTLKTALLVSACAAALGIGAPLAVMFKAQTVDHRRPDPIEAVKTVNADSDGPDAAANASAQTPMESPQAALALAPQATTGGAGAGAAGLYNDAAHRIETRDLTGVEQMRKVANLGYAPAQVYLARLYEAGDAGVKKDLAEARRWTERAAQNGDRKAMHNLGLYYFEGTGGPKNTTLAAQWFRKASDLGLVDSQYNLARLYEEGFGVGQNLAEAYKWYLIASRAGDAESGKAAQRLKKTLSAEAQASASRSALSFRAETPAGQPIAAVALGGQSTGAQSAQKALSRLGYYQGPRDGVSSPALKLAIAAYQRDQGLPQTGVLDQGLIDRFSSLAQ